VGCDGSRAESRSESGAIYFRLDGSPKMDAEKVKLTEFSDLINGYTADFVGRGWLVARLERLMAEPDCRIVVLTGGPGVGKTAFLAHLAAEHPNWLRYFIRRNSQEILKPGDAKTFLLTIGGQLATLRPELFHPENLEVIVRQRVEDVEPGGQVIGAWIGKLRASPFYRTAIQVEHVIGRARGGVIALKIDELIDSARLLSMQDLQELGLLYPARLLSLNGSSARIVVLVDALDELRYSPADPDIVRTLREMPDIPENLRFIVSSRDENLELLGRLLARNDARHLHLDVTEKENLNDLGNYAGRVISVPQLQQALAEVGSSPEAFADTLLAKAAGNFLYLRSVLDAIQESLADPEKKRLPGLLDVNGLPGDLPGLYGHFLTAIVGWCRQEFPTETWRRYLSPLLAAMAVAQAPVSDAQLVAFCGLSSQDVETLLREMRQFIETMLGTPRTHRIFHASFAEYLTDRERNSDYWVDGPAADRRIVDHYLGAWGGLALGLPRLCDPGMVNLDGRYGLRHLAAHLEAAGRSVDLDNLLGIERARIEEPPAELQGVRGWIDRLVHGPRKHKPSRAELIWFAVKDQAGETAGFLSDVRRAWLSAAARLRGVERPDETEDLIGLLYHYSLITSSINSLAGSFPPALMIALAKNRALLGRRDGWKPAKILAYIDRIQDERVDQSSPDHFDLRYREERKRSYGSRGQRKSEALIAIAGDLPETMLREAIRIADSIRLNGNGTGFKALAVLASHLPEAERVEEVRKYWADVQSAMSDKWDDVKAKVESIAELVPLLPEPERDEAIREAFGALDNEDFHRGHDYDEQRALSLVALLRAFSTMRRERVLRYTFDRILDDAIAATRKVFPVSERIKVWSKLLPLIPETREKIERETQLTLFEVIPDAPEIEGRQTYIQEALQDAGFYEACTNRAAALEVLVPHIPPGLEKLEKEAINLIWSLPGDIAGKVKLQCAAARLLPESTLREAIAEAESVSDWKSLVKTRAELASRIKVPGPGRDLELRPAIGALQRVGEVEYRYELLAQLAKLMSPLLLDEALDIVVRIGDEASRAVTIATLAFHLPKRRQERALQIAREAAEEVQWDDRSCIGLLGVLAPVLSKPQLGRALQGALAVTLDPDHHHLRADAITSLAPVLTPPLLMEAAAAVHDWWLDDASRVRALNGLMPYLSKHFSKDYLVGFLFKTLDASERWAMFSRQFRAMVLTHLVRMSCEIEQDRLFDRMLEEANHVHQAERISLLLVMASQLPEPYRSRVLAQATDLAQRESDDLDYFRSMAEYKYGWVSLDEVSELSAPERPARPDIELSSSTPSCHRLGLEVVPERLGGYSRRDLLDYLRANANVLRQCGPAVIEEVIEVIQDVARWWP